MHIRIYLSIVLITFSGNYLLQAQSISASSLIKLAKGCNYEMTESYALKNGFKFSNVSNEDGINEYTFTFYKYNTAKKKIIYRISPDANNMSMIKYLTVFSEEYESLKSEIKELGYKYQTTKNTDLTVLNAYNKGKDTIFLMANKDSSFELWYVYVAPSNNIINK